jgi:hypothetical protein
MTTPLQTPRSVQSQSGAATPRNHSASRVSARSRSGGERVGGVAFGRHTPQRKQQWEVHQIHGDDSPSVLSQQRQKAIPLHVVTIDEINSIDSLTVGGPSGSVRLERYTPAVGPKSTAHVGKLPYSLQEPVTVVIENGLIEVKKTSLPPVTGGTSAGATASDIICSLPLDALSKVELTTGGLSCFGREGLELMFTIHAQSKQVMLYKYLHAKIKGVIPATTAELTAIQQRKAEEEALPTANAGSVTIIKEVSNKVRLRVASASQQRSSSRIGADESTAAGINGHQDYSQNGLSAPRSNGTATPQAVPPEGASGASATPTPVAASDDRQHRREVLYAQLREIRLREAARNNPSA